VKEIMERLFQLESQHRDQEALELLEAAAERRDFTAKQRERFDFELGKRMEKAHALDAAICAHWRRHLSRFEHAQHEDEIRRTLANCRQN
jgi:hypothetical protein